MKFLWSRIFRLILFLALLAMTGKILVNGLLAYGLRWAFEGGTGCDVQLRSPRVSFFPVRASVEEVAIRCLGEAETEGFFAERVSARLLFPALFRRAVVLTDLEIDGAHAESRRPNGGFFQTINFLFGGEEDSRQKAPDRWRLFVHNVAVTPAPARETLRLSFGDISLAWSKLRLVAEIPEPDDEPARITANAEDFQFEFHPGMLFAFGSVTAEGTVGQGQIRLAELVSMLPSEKGTLSPGEVSVVRAIGDVRLRGEGSYDLSLETGLKPEFFNRGLARQWPWMLSLQPSLEWKGRVTGRLDSPHAEGALRLRLEGEPPFIQRKGCFPREVVAELNVGPREVELRELLVDDLIFAERLAFGFFEMHPVEGEFRVLLDREKELFRRCFPDDMRRSELALRDAVANSDSRIVITGELKSPRLEFQLSSDSDLRERRYRTHLEATASYTPTAISVRVSERGGLSTPRTGEAALSSVVREAQAQPLRRPRPDSNLTAELAYRFEDRLVTLSTLSIERYPVQRLLVRAAPFIDHRVFALLSGVTDDISSLTAEASLETRLDDGHRTGKATLTLNDLLLGAERTTLSLEARFDGSDLYVEPIELATTAGVILGQGFVDGHGKISGAFQGVELDLQKLSSFAQLVPGVAIGSGEFNLSVTGELRAPTYVGTFTVTHPEESVFGVARSRVTAEGTLKAISFTADLGNGRAQGELIFSLEGGSRDELRLQGTAKDFPIEALLSSELRTRSGASGELSGTIKYVGSLAEPLSGMGALSIDKLIFRTGGGVIRNLAPLEARISGGKLTFDDIRVASADREIRITGRIDRRNGWDARLVGAWDVASAFTGVRGIEQASGIISADIGIHGPLQSPNLRGTLELVSGAVSFPLGRSVVGATDIAARARVDQDTLRIEEISAVVGEGKLSGEGRVAHLFDPDLRETSIELSLDEVSLEPVENLFLILDGDLRLEQERPTGPIRFGGGLRVREGVYEDTIDLAQVLQAITRFLTGRRVSVEPRFRNDGPRGQGVELDLRLATDSSLLVETNVVQAELSMDLRVTGPVSALRADGKIIAERGVIGSQTTPLEIVSGEVLFSERAGELDPRLQITALGTLRSPTAEPDQVRMMISGTLLRPVIRFDSDSGLSDNEIVSRLGLAVGARNAFTLASSRERGGTLSEYVRRTSEMNLTDRVAQLAGFEEVNIRPSMSAVTGEFSPSVVARRRLPRGVDLILESKLTGDGESSGTLEYPLTPNLSLFGRWKNRRVNEFEKSAGAFDTGVRVRRGFSGTGIFPRSLLSFFRREEK